jgi:hypothetical protein
MEFKPTLMDRTYDEGAAQARAADLLKVLELRGFLPSASQRKAVESCSNLDQANRWFDRALTATSVGEVFAD